ncbi:MAG: Lrp/AsnC ligand binding domain-containing protein [Thaumarchaeota archaeon]|nr:Lrp/AsnC ligand binding domain-containing protein [Nitrososphaerota archaeon]
MLSACVLIRTEKGKFDDVAKNLKQIHEVKDVFTALGRFDIVADLEAEDGKQLARAVLNANRLAGVVFTETLPEVEA